MRAKEISSRQNKYIKLLERSKRAKGAWGQYSIAEGTRLCEEVLKTDIEIIAAFFDEQTDIPYADQYMTKSQLNFICSHDLFKQISETQNPQGILLLLNIPRHKDLSTIDLEKKIGSQLSILVLENIQDPGNMGTLIRTAYAFDYDLVIVCGQRSCDPYHTKTLRSSMGGAFNLDIYQIEKSREVLEWCQENSIEILATSLDGQNIAAFKRQQQISLWIGNEANGLSSEVLTQADSKLTIPMPGHAESLNAAIAGAISMYELKSGH